MAAAVRPALDEIGDRPMQDPAFKTVFCHPAAIERLVRRYAPEQVGRIDFSTLEKLDAELVGEALVRRYPDMLWMAQNVEGAGSVVIQLEFQGRRERLMALRMAVYQLLTVQQLLRRNPSLRAEQPLEVLSFVVYHGPGRARASSRLRELFPRWVPGEYRLISRREGESRVKGDLAQTILELERDRSFERTVAALAELQEIANEIDSDYDRLMAECVAEMLISTKRISRQQIAEARTMAEVMTIYQRSLEEWGRTRYRQGRDEGIRQGRDEGIRQGRDEWIRQGRAAMLAQLVCEKLGTEAADELASLLGRGTGSARLTMAASALLESATAEDFLARLRRSFSD